MASEKQIKYLENLLLDCGFTDRKQRNSYLTSEVGRDIVYLDDLTIPEASHMIDMLRDMRDERRFEEEGRKSWERGDY